MSAQTSLPCELYGIINSIIMLHNYSSLFHSSREDVSQQLLQTIHPADLYNTHTCCSKQPINSPSNDKIFLTTPSFAFAVLPQGVPQRVDAFFCSSFIIYNQSHFKMISLLFSHYYGVTHSANITNNHTETNNSPSLPIAMRCTVGRSREIDRRN